MASDIFNFLHFNRNNHKPVFPDLRKLHCKNVRQYLQFDMTVNFSLSVYVCQHLKLSIKKCKLS